MATILTVLDTLGLRRSHISMVVVSTPRMETPNHMKRSQLEAAVREIQQDIRPTPAVRIVQWIVLLLFLQKSLRRHTDLLDLVTTPSTYLLAVGSMTSMLVMEDRYNKGMDIKTRDLLHCHARRAPLEFQSSWELQVETPSPQHRDLEPERNARAGLGSALASPRWVSLE